MVTIRSGDVSAKRLYAPSYFLLTSSAVQVTSTPSDLVPASKPIWTQVRELLHRGYVSSDMSSASYGRDELTMELPPATMTLTARLESLASPLRYEVLAHATRDIQLQLSYLHTHGVYVWSLVADDIYCMEVSEDNWRYVLITENVSLGVGSSGSLLAFLREHVDASYQGTKLQSYMSRLASYGESLWV